MSKENSGINIFRRRRKRSNTTIYKPKKKNVNFLKFLLGGRKRSKSDVKNVEKIFGKKMKDCDPWLLAMFLIKSIDFIGEHLEENIFRKSGAREEVNTIVLQLNSYTFGKKIDFTKIDIASVCESLKKYLRILPRHILADIFEDIICRKLLTKINPGTINYEEGKPLSNFSAFLKDEIKTILKKKLPHSKKIFLYALFGLLKKIHKKEDQYKVNANSLAILFTPILFTKDLASFYERNSGKSYKLGTKIVESLILDHDEYFGDLITENDKLDIRQGLFLALQTEQRSLDFLGHSDFNDFGPKTF